MHINEINMKNRVYNYYFDNLVTAREKKEIVAKNILINYSMRKTIMDQPFILLDMFKKS